MVPVVVLVVLVVVLVVLGVVFVSTGSSSGLPVLLPVLKPPPGPSKPPAGPPKPPPGPISAAGWLWTGGRNSHECLRSNFDTRAFFTRALRPFFLHNSDGWYPFGMIS